MTSGDIEARFELYVGAVDEELGIRYHHVAEAILRQDERRVKIEARYDIEDQTIELNYNYYLNDEFISQSGWAKSGSIHQPGKVERNTLIGQEFDENDIVISPLGAEAACSTGRKLDEVIESYVKSRFFSEPEAELGEIFDDTLE